MKARSTKKITKIEAKEKQEKVSKYECQGDQRGRERRRKKEEIRARSTEDKTIELSKIDAKEKKEVAKDEAKKTGIKAKAESKVSKIEARNR